MVEGSIRYDYVVLITIVDAGVSIVQQNLNQTETFLPIISSIASLKRSTPAINKHN